jgi:hypothetical protein
VSTPTAVNAAQTPAQAHPVPAACDPAVSGPTITCICANPAAPTADVPPPKVIAPPVTLHCTVIPATAPELSATATCGVHPTVTPAATYSTGLTAVTVRTRTTAVNEPTSVPALPTADNPTAPAATGVTVVEATPAAFVITVQLALPQAPNCTEPLLAENTTAAPATGSTPSHDVIFTANGVVPTSPTYTVPVGADTSVITFGGAAEYVNAPVITVLPPVCKSVTATSATSEPALEAGATATIDVELQLVTVAATPFTVTTFPARNPVPVIVTVPPPKPTLAGEIESA